LARKLGFVYIDSGAMYRAITLHGMRNGYVHDGVVDEARLVGELKEMKISFRYNRILGQSDTLLNDESVESEIRTMEISNHVSQVSTVPAVREKLKHIQQSFGANKGVVMDGRDIGTVILPNAPLKLFMTASPAIRAWRRFEELKAKGDTSVTMDAVLENLRFRDHEDTNRAVSPLKQADDAIVIDNTELDEDEQMDVALGHAIRVMAMAGS
jgi:cytidylate kinase